MEIPILKKKILDAVNKHKLIELRELARNSQQVDFAEALSEIEPKIVLMVFRMLDTEEAAEIFTYLSSELQEFIISSYSNGEIKEIIDELYSDDIIDLIDQMPAEIVKKILRSTSAERRAEINDILKYDEETAGGIMSVNFIEIKQNISVDSAISTIKKNDHDLETADSLFVINDYGELTGQLEFKQLVFNNGKTKVSKIMNPRIVSVKIDTDQEEVAQTFKRYDLNVLPVVDNKNKLVGIITVDDVIDVLDKEVTEDMAKLAGIFKTNDSYFEISIFKMVRLRAIWLLIILLLGTISQALLIIFFKVYEVDKNLSDKGFFAIMLLAPMILMLAAVIGSSGNQSATMMVRSLSLHEVKKKELGKILLKELTSSLIIALILMITNIVRLIIVYSVQFESLNNNQIWSAIIVSSITIAVGVILANIIGILLPLAAKGIKLDPTVAASPLVTTIADIATISIAFAVGLAFI